jgi:competence protein ComEC
VGAAAAVAAAARPRFAAAIGWSCAVALLAAGAGAVVGSARLGAIDSGAAHVRAGQRILATGHVVAVPRRSGDDVLVELETAAGRLLIRTGEPVGELTVGAEVRAAGTIAEPEPWRAGRLARRGIATVFEVEGIEATGAVRGGLSGRVDAIRNRAEAALGRGMPEPEEALARGFVLGEDDRIDPRTVIDFKRSGLAHLLAVSGQNVILLCLLAWPLLAVAGLTLRARLLALLALIAVYVAVTGAGPSIQRAGVMGAAGLIAGLAGTPRSRWYALLLAVVVTLALNPRASGDAGWQLSFAATAGIMLWSARLGELLAGEPGRSPARRALADGVAVTVAATAATAPLMAHHFDALSLAALPANLLALPAVAPAMWLGMLVGILGQLPAIPVEPLNWLNSLLLGYIAQVARWMAEPGWASVRLGLGSPAALALSYVALAGAAELALRAARRRGGLSLGSRRPVGSARLLRRAVPVLALAAVALLLIAGRGGGTEAPEDALRVSVLDVGQGDSILLEPPGAPAVLVDTGPAEAHVAELLRDRGVDSLAALVLTHDQADHTGGAFELFGSIPVARLAYARLERGTLSAAREAAVEPIRLAEGSELRVGELRLEVLWPPPGLSSGPVDDPNAAAVVLLAEWRHFSILLTADAEAELVPLEPGPVDVLKVAHHGSEDSGLAALLDRAVPKLAVVSVGEDNSYGHPAPETIATLGAHGVPAARTDEDGTITIEADAGGWTVVGR